MRRPLPSRWQIFSQRKLFQIYSRWRTVRRKDNSSNTVLRTHKQNQDSNEEHGYEHLINMVPKDFSFWIHSKTNPQLGSYLRFSLESFWKLSYYYVVFVQKYWTSNSCCNFLRYETSKRERHTKILILNQSSLKGSVKWIEVEQLWWTLN